MFPWTLIILRNRSTHTFIKEVSKSKLLISENSCQGPLFPRRNDRSFSLNHTTLGDKADDVLVATCWLSSCTKWIKTKTWKHLELQTKLLCIFNKNERSFCWLHNYVIATIVFTYNLEYFNWFINYDFAIHMYSRFYISL